MNEPRKLISRDEAAPVVMPTADTHPEVFDSAVRLRDMRAKRSTDRLSAKLDRSVPVATMQVQGATVAVVDDDRWESSAIDGEFIEDREDFTGDVYRVMTKCQDCFVDIPLDSIEEPGLWARMIELGVLRRVRGTVRCDGCLAQIIAAEEAVEVDSKKRERLERSELPEAMRGFYFNEMLPEGGRKFVVEKIRDWASVSRPANGIYLWGDKGRGKTRLAATAASARLATWDVRYVSMPILLAQLSAAFTDGARQAALQVLTGRGALIIDDFDKTTPSEWAANQIFAAVDSRLQAGAPLLITSNLPPQRLGDKFKGEVGAAIESRCAGLDVYELPGRDNRVEFPGLTKMSEEDAARHGLSDPEEDLDT